MLQMSGSQYGCESPWQRMGGTQAPPSDLPLSRPRPTSYPGSSSAQTQPFLNLSQSESFPKKGELDSSNLDQSEFQTETGNSQSVETPVVEEDTQMTSVSEDCLQQSLHCDYCSDNDVEDEIHQDFCDASTDPDSCNPQSDVDHCNLLTDQDQCNPAYEPDQEDEEQALLGNEHLDSQTSFPQRSHDQSGDSELKSCDSGNQSKGISVDRRSRPSSSQKSTAV